MVDAESVSMGAATAAFETAVTAMDQNVDLAHAISEEIATFLVQQGGHTLATVFSEALIGKYISFEVEGDMQTFEIIAIASSSSVVLDRQVSAAVSNVEYRIRERQERIRMAASDVNVFFGAPGGAFGLEVSDADFAMVLLEDDAGNSSYALDASGSLRLLGFEGILEIGGDVSVRINTTGQAVDETINVADTSVHLLFEDGSQIRRVEGTGLSLDIFGFVSLSGDFGFQYVEGEGSIEIGAANVNAAIGTDDGGVSLVDGLMGLILYENGGVTTYALVARGVTILDINSVSVSGEVVVEINNTGMAQDTFISVNADQEVHVLFANGNYVQDLNASEVELRLINSIGRWVDDLGADLAARKADLVPVINDDGTVTYNSVLAEPIPGSSDTLDSVLGMSDLFAIGEYIQHYMHPYLRADEPLAEGDMIPLGEYDPATGPTLGGLNEYLQQYWVPTLDRLNIEGEGLQIEITETGFQISFDISASFVTGLDMAFGKEFYDFGLTIDSSVSLFAQVDFDLDFEVSLDWTSGEFAFNLNTLNFQVEASADDGILAATYGPLSLSLGKEDGDTASLNLALGGAISYVAGDFQFTPGNSSIYLDLPVYGSLAGIDLSPTGTP